MIVSFSHRWVSVALVLALVGPLSAVLSRLRTRNQQQSLGWGGSVCLADQLNGPAHNKRKGRTKESKQRTQRALLAFLLHLIWPFKYTNIFSAALSSGMKINQNQLISPIWERAALCDRRQGAAPCCCGVFKSTWGDVTICLRYRQFFDVGLGRLSIYSCQIHLNVQYINAHAHTQTHTALSFQ